MTTDQLAALRRIYQDLGGLNQQQAARQLHQDLQTLVALSPGRDRQRLDAKLCDRRGLTYYEFEKVKAALRCLRSDIPFGAEVRDRKHVHFATQAAIHLHSVLDSAGVPAAQHPAGKNTKPTKPKIAKAVKRAQKKLAGALTQRELKQECAELRKQGNELKKGN